MLELIQLGRDYITHPTTIPNDKVSFVNSPYDVSPLDDKYNPWSQTYTRISHKAIKGNFNDKELLSLITDVIHELHNNSQGRLFVTYINEDQMYMKGFQIDFHKERIEELAAYIFKSMDTYLTYRQRHEDNLLGVSFIYYH